MDDYRRLVNYFVESEVPKSVNAKIISLVRNPAPEVLRGQRSYVLSTLAALSHTHRLSAFTLTFAESDIPVPSFHAGDHDLYVKVETIIDLALAIAYPGVPKQARPACLVTTHTHTGRLELNFALPRCVIRPDGVVRAHNPRPPGAWSHELWRAFVDMVNGRFGFDDPGALARVQLIRLPNDVAKELAEAARNLHVSRYQPLKDFAQAATDEAHDMLRTEDCPTRDGFLQRLSRHLASHGMTLEEQLNSGTAFTFRQGHRSKRIVLKGPMMSNAFDPFLKTWPEWARERTRVLAEAPKMLEARWQSAAQSTTQRHHFSAPKRFDALAEFLAPLPEPAPQLVRRRGREERPIASILHRLVTNGLMRGFVMRLVAALPLTLFSDALTRLEALNARYATQSGNTHAPRIQGSDRIQPPTRGDDSSPGSPARDREGARRSGSPGSVDHRNQRSRRADVGGRDVDVRSDRGAAQGERAPGRAGPRDGRTDGAYAREIAALGVKELDTRIEALLERLGGQREETEAAGHSAPEPEQNFWGDHDDAYSLDGP